MGVGHYRCQMAGGEFHIMKKVAIGGRATEAMRPIAVLEHFPARDDVIRVWEEERGGGR